MSGGWNSKGKLTADSVKKLSTKMLRDYGYFAGRTMGSITWVSSGHSIGVEVRLVDMKVRIFYTQTNEYSTEKKDFNYEMPLVSSLCRYGGVRYWFICACSKGGRYCGRRVAKLYKANDYFACRHCYNLTYVSRNAGGYNKGFVSAVDLDQFREGLKRTQYAGKPTRKYRRYLKLEENFERGFLNMYQHLIRKR